VFAQMWKKKTYGEFANLDVVDAERFLLFSGT
jgi:hypothetical protein